MLFMKLDETAESIRTMNIRGAGLIARSAAEALKELAEEYDGESLIEFTEILNKGRDTLVNSRPTAVSLWNAVQATLKNVKNAEDVTSLKEIVSRDALQQQGCSKRHKNSV